MIARKQRAIFYEEVKETAKYHYENQFGAREPRKPKTQLQPTNPAYVLNKDGAENGAIDPKDVKD